MALVGLGLAGQDHLAAMSTVADLDIVGACDLCETRIAQAREQFPDLRYYQDMREMFDRERPDGVAVVTDANGHHPVAMEAIRRGIHVIVEKPLASDTARAREIARAAQEAGVVLAVTFTCRFIPETRKMAEVIHSGTLGRLLAIRYIRLEGETGLPPRNTPARLFIDRRYRAGEGGVVYDCGVHAFDLFQWWAQSRLRNVRASARNLHGYAYPDAMTAVLEFDNNVKAVYDHDPMPFMARGVGKPGLFLIEASCTEGSLFYQFGQPDASGQLHSLLHIADASGIQTLTFPIYKKMRGTQYAQFLDSIRQGQLVGWWGSAEDAIAAGEIAERVLAVGMQNMLPPLQEKLSDQEAV